MNINRWVLFLGFWVFWFFGARGVQAVVDPLEVVNNRVGIHILEADEVKEAAKLVNSNGGEWGYVTIPIRATDRDLEKWRRFFIDCGGLKVIPILRLATYGEGGGWARPDLAEVLDMANFLEQMPWPAVNRYVIVYNEPNHAAEWGGEVDPVSYGEILEYAEEIFEKRSGEFFVLSAGLDAAAPDNNTSMESRKFILEVNKAVPGVYNKIDGWASHAYPNPAYAGRPEETHKGSIAGYRHELAWLASLGVEELPVFITETGWSTRERGDEQVGEFLQTAFAQVWQDENLVAVTPFLLRAGEGVFEEFSLIGEDGGYLPSYLAMAGLGKTKGNPEMREGGFGVEAGVEVGVGERKVEEGELEQIRGRVAGVGTSGVRVEGLGELWEKVREFWERVSDRFWATLRMQNLLRTQRGLNKDITTGEGTTSDGDGTTLVPHWVQGETQRTQKELRTLNVGDVVVKVQVADDPEEITRGLSGREKLGGDEGMLFELGGEREARFWMKEMEFDLDMIWIRGDKVVGYTENVPKPEPGQILQDLPTYSSMGLVDRVLEVNAGWVRRNGIKVGDEVGWVGGD